MSIPDSAPSHLPPDAPLAELARTYLRRLLEMRRNEASNLIYAAVHGGVPVKDVYLHVFQPVQRELGRMWRRNEISVAVEHFCTAATQLTMGRLYPWISSGVRDRGLVVASAVEGELHELGTRMVADFFELAGLDTVYLGANTTIQSIVHLMGDRAPDILALSATLEEHVEVVRDAIRAVRARPELRSTIVLVGGAPFNRDPELWSRVGGDGGGRDAEQAVASAQRLLAARDAG